MVIGVPLLIGVASRLRADPKPLLLILAFAVTVGSTLTPFGNPQNLLVAVASGVSSPVTTFLRYLAVPTVINLLLGGWYVRWVYSPKIPSTTPPGVSETGRISLFPEHGWARRLEAYPVILIFPATMTVLVTLDITSAITRGPEVPIWEVALAGAVVLLLLSPGRTQTVQRVNWSILLLFAGLFVVVAGAVEGGVISALDGVFPVPGPAIPPGRSSPSWERRSGEASSSATCRGLHSRSPSSRDSATARATPSSGWPSPRAARSLATSPSWGR